MVRGFIPQEIIDEITARIDIVDVISEYVPLKKRGKNFLGLCPFHHEKTPSFSVSPEKQIFRCFGCGVGGNVFKFLMQIENLSFPEAVERLAQRAGISLPDKELTKAEKKILEYKDRLYRINELASIFYHKVLLNTKWGKPVLEYLKNRDIDSKMIEKFQLGFSLPSWDGLIKFITPKGISIKDLLDLGLVLPKKSGKGYFDRFRNRLMFPIRDFKGRVVAFGGRVLGNDEPKYLNSPDTPLFNKGYHLYGLDLAKNEIRSKDLAVIVEGYMDVIACHQYGVNNAVASLGTAFTQNQAKLLMRHTYQVAIAYDADTAGSKATLKGLDLLNELGCQVKVVNLPQGLDPDEFLRKMGKDKFTKLIDEGQSLIEYKLEKAMENINSYSLEGKIRITREVLPDLLKIDSPVGRESAIKLISEKLGILDTTVLSELRKYTQEKRRYKSKEKDRIMEKRENNNISLCTKKNKAAFQLLKILYENNEFFSQVEKEGGKELFESPLKELYQELYQIWNRKGKIMSTDLQDNDSQLLADILMQELDLPDLNKAVTDYIKKLKINKLDRDYVEKKQRLKDVEKTGDVEKLKLLLTEIENILQQKKLLAP